MALQSKTLKPSLRYPRASRHFISKVLAEKFDGEAIVAALANPTEVYPSGSHPGQWRVTGNGYCIVGAPDGNEFRLITVFRDRVLTPPREDQLNTPEGRRYAERYAKGLGRG